MTSLAKATGIGRIVTGAKIAHPCGDPELSNEEDIALRRRIVKCALQALQTEVEGPTVFIP